MPQEPTTGQGQEIDIPLKSERKQQQAPAAGMAYVVLGLVVVGAIISAFFWLLNH